MLVILVHSIHEHGRFFQCQCFLLFLVLIFSNFLCKDLVCPLFPKVFVFVAIVNDTDPIGFFLSNSIVHVIMTTDICALILYPTTLSVLLLPIISQRCLVILLYASGLTAMTGFHLFYLFPFDLFFFFFSYLIPLAKTFRIILRDQLEWTSFSGCGLSGNASNFS